MNTKKLPTRNALLSCDCLFEYGKYPAYAGDYVTCKYHGPVTVVEGAPRDSIILFCDQCSYRRVFHEIVKLSPCQVASKHMMKMGHDTHHYHELDEHGTMCSHTVSSTPTMVLADPPF